MFLESLLLRGEQIKNTPLPYSFLPLSLTLCSTNTNANRCSALSQRQHLVHSQIDNVKALCCCFSFSFWCSCCCCCCCCCPFKCLCKVALNCEWPVEKCCIDTCVACGMGHVACGIAGGRRGISTGNMINAWQLTIQGKSCTTLSICVMVIAIVVVVAVAKLFNVLNAFNSSAIPF